MTSGFSAEQMDPLILDEEEYIEYLRAQRRAHMAPEGDRFGNLDDDSDHAPHMPPIPDMRFEKQINRSIEVLQAKNASALHIFLSVVLKDQIIMPFLNGFFWGIGAHAVRWYRYRPKHGTSESHGNGYWRRLGHKINTSIG
ncbi:hypothetical protein NQZ79_g8586 [Umbelopsis isabellina]|nr:hypothetical protein NQZ79_g8586 [Umbelopsis isabellina]